MSDPEEPREAIEGAETLFAGVTAATAETLDAAPRRIDRYEILGFLGAGGMGAVYRVRDEELGDLVALKMLRADLTAEPGALDRFRDEVRLARPAALTLRVAVDQRASSFLDALGLELRG